MYIYRLTHEYFCEADQCDRVTEIAVYSSKEKAEAALARFKVHPFFAQKSGEFCIDRWQVDQPTWAEGFVPFEEE